MLLDKYKFKTKPMEHQIVGLGGMMSQFENHSPEYALFMEMGCGKTKVLIDGQKQQNTFNMKFMFGKALKLKKNKTKLNKNYLLLIKNLKF